MYYFLVKRINSYYVSHEKIILFVAGYYRAWSGNGVPRRKSYCDGTDANGSHSRQRFRVQFK